jgi:aryl-alcohol dehydrogenase-like predicted oxidoreductase
MTRMITGHATAEGTARYAARFPDLPAAHFREFADGIRLSTLGLGTYLGPDDDATDTMYARATTRALERGLNVLDSAINYRHQRSERAVGSAIAHLVARGALARDEIFVATKGGFIPFDGAVPGDPGAYVTGTYLRPGIVQPGDVVAGAHCMTPAYLRDQIDRSRANLGLQTIDLYYIHNPEMQLEEIDRPTFLDRIRATFAALEEAATAGAIGAYGTATWNGYRQDPATAGHLSLPELVDLAREVGGDGHRFRAVQLPYNLAMPEAFVHANQKFPDGLVPPLEAARRLGIYVMASASIYQGQLARRLPALVAEYLPGLETDAQRAIQFVRSTPGIGTALVGMKSPEHVDENAGVARVAPAPWEQFQRFFAPA